MTDAQIKQFVDDALDCAAEYRATGLVDGEPCSPTDLLMMLFEAESMLNVLLSH